MADDMRYYRVSPRFWATTRHWTDPARLLGFYILTCQHRTVEGLFWLPKAYICADLEWLPERLAEPFQELLDDDFIDYHEPTQVALIVKALRYQSPANPNGVKAALRQLAVVPESPLDQRFHQLAERYSERLAERLPERFTEPFAQPLGEPPTPTPTPTPPPTRARTRPENPPDTPQKAAGEDPATPPPNQTPATRTLTAITDNAPPKTAQKLRAGQTSRHTTAVTTALNNGWTPHQIADTINQRGWNGVYDPAAALLARLRDLNDPPKPAEYFNSDTWLQQRSQGVTPPDRPSPTRDQALADIRAKLPKRGAAQ